MKRMMIGVVMMTVWTGFGAKPEELVDCPVSENLRGHENVEWSIAYGFDLTNEKKDLPRVLLVGDSICNGYKDEVRRLLDGRMTVSYWISSYCVTSPGYLRLLSFYLDEAKYNVVHFNNGLHSLQTDDADYEKGLRAALTLIRAKQPTTRIIWATSTPLKDAVKTEKAKRLNAIAAKVIAEFKDIAVDDLFSAMDPLDRTKNWRDTYHFTEEARIRQGGIVADAILPEFNGSGHLQLLALVPQPRDVVLQGGFTDRTNETVVTDQAVPPEGYRLKVSSDGVEIVSSDEAGTFYARQTLKQLVDGTNYLCATVSDSPVYRWRGMHFDDCRHFFGKDVLKKTLDLMAQHKMNVLHWHLTEDQGWRLDIPGYPELVKYGAVRSASPKHGAKVKWIDKTNDIYTMDTDGQNYGPYFYTEGDVKEILAYAAERHITIVPEIELPGHVYAALAAYPEFACCPENLAKRSPRLIWGIEKDVLCIGNEKAIKFMEDVLDYVCRLFPSEVIHIGGDECPQERWKTCPKCQKRIKDEGLEDEHDLQPWITRHFVKFLAARGKRALGWDEYLLGEGIPKSAMGMSWRIGKQGAGHDWLSPADLAAKGHDVVMTPNDYCYLDYAQGIEDDPFQYIGGCVTLEKCHSLDLRSGVPANMRKHIIGGQGNNWSEYTWNQYDLEWKMWPRGCALAEVFWCGDGKPPFDDFLRRMKVHRRRLVRQGVNCAPAW